MIKLSDNRFLDEKRIVSAQVAEGADSFEPSMELVVEGVSGPLIVTGADWRRICERLGVR